MKKITALSVIALIIIGISSCGKKGCTDAAAPNYNSNATKDDGTCTDLTASIVGTYNGTTTDSSISQSTSNSNNEQITITKVDDSHITITAANGGSMPTITANVTSSIGGFSAFTIANQTWSGSTIVSNTSAINGFTVGTRSLTVSVVVDADDVLTFSGSHQ